MKGYETKKKGIGLKPFKEKETGKEAVSNKEKILVKLMNKHDCSREEAKSKYVKCFKCNDYVNHWTDECTKSNDTTKSKDKLKTKRRKLSSQMRTAAFHFHRMTIPMLPALHQTIIQNMLMLCRANRYMERLYSSIHD